VFLIFFTNPSIPPVETAVWSAANGIKEFYVEGTDSF